MWLGGEGEEGSDGSLVPRVDASPSTAKQKRPSQKPAKKVHASLILRFVVRISVLSWRPVDARAKSVPSHPLPSVGSQKKFPDERTFGPVSAGVRRTSFLFDGVRTDISEICPNLSGAAGQRRTSGTINSEADGHSRKNCIFAHAGICTRWAQVKTWKPGSRRQ